MSVGVGRGRGRLPQQVNGDIEPLRRPNIAPIGRGRLTQPQSVTKSKFSDVEASVSDPKIDCMALFKALDEFLSSKPTQEELSDLFNKIVDKILRMKTNCDCICKCLYLASKNKTVGSLFLTTLFEHLQQKFTDVDSVRESYGPVGVWRFQQYFSSLSHYARNQKVAPFPELIDGLKSLCLDSNQPTNPEEAKIAAITIARCVYYLKMTNEEQNQINPVIFKIRGLLHMSGSAAISKPDICLWLALGLETVCLVGSKLPDETLTYYCSKLGPEAAAFNLVSTPAINLPKQVQSNYNFTDISYILNFI